MLYVVLLLNCDNEPYEGDIMIEDNSCELAILATVNVAANFNTATAEDFNFLCQAYKVTLENQIDICGDANGLLQVIIDELGDCTVDDELCDEAIAATEVAQNNYISSTDINFITVCNAYKEALQYQIEVCGDDGILQSIVEELGTCSPVFVETVGTWKLVAWLTDISRDIDNDGVVTNNYLEEIDCYENETLIFNSDSTGTLFLRSIADITYTPIADSPNEEDFFVTCNIIDEEKLFTWEQDGSNTLIFTMADGTIVNYFRNANSLFIAVDNGFSATSTIDGTSIIAERVTYVYVKL